MEDYTDDDQEEKKMLRGMTMSSLLRETKRSFSVTQCPQCQTLLTKLEQVAKINFSEFLLSLPAFWKIYASYAALNEDLVQVFIASMVVFLHLYVKLSSSSIHVLQLEW